MLKKYKINSFKILEFPNKVVIGKEGSITLDRMREKLPKSTYYSFSMNGEYDYANKEFNIKNMGQIKEKIGGAGDNKHRKMEINVVIEKVDKTGGDPFYEKYMKYKLKYLQLKGDINYE
jgi:hypothetical protein